MAVETYVSIRRIAKSEDHGESAPVTVPLGGSMRFLIFVFNAYSIIIFVTLLVKEYKKGDKTYDFLNRYHVKIFCTKEFCSKAQYLSQVFISRVTRILLFKY